MIDVVTTEDSVTASGPDGNVLWRYVHGRRKPYIHPVTTPSGRVLTQLEPPDHPWHRALWFAIKYVDGDNFWEEVPPYGVVRHDRVATRFARDTVSVDARLRWIRPDRETVAIRESREITHHTLDAGSYALDVRITLDPVAAGTIDRTPFNGTWGGYGGLTVRGRPDWHDTRLLLDDGSEHARIEGVPSAWCDLSGTIEGEAAGIAMLDSPENPRHPVPWYGSTRAATYGDEGWSNFLNAAFLFDEPLQLEGPLELAYRVVIHDGAWDHERVRAAWEEWTA